MDQPLKDAPDFKRYSERLTQITIHSTPQLQWEYLVVGGTGKTTMMKMIEKEINEKKYSDVATTIWFDSWRYEREKYSLMIPLLRTIILTLRKVIVQEKKDKSKGTLGGFARMLKSIVVGTDTNSNISYDTIRLSNINN